MVCARESNLVSKKEMSDSALCFLGSFSAGEIGDLTRVLLDEDCRALDELEGQEFCC